MVEIKAPTLRVRNHHVRSEKCSDTLPKLLQFYDVTVLACRKMNLDLPVNEMTHFTSLWARGGKKNNKKNNDNKIKQNKTTTIARLKDWTKCSSNNREKRVGESLKTEKKRYRRSISFYSALTNTLFTRHSVFKKLVRWTDSCVCPSWLRKKGAARIRKVPALF